MRELLGVLVARDFKLRYKRSILGVAWSLLVPLAQLGVLYVVFSQILPLNIPHYTTFLFIGILPWTWFQSSLLSASGTIVDNRDFVKQIGFPVGVLPTITVISQLIHLLLAVPILAVFLMFDKIKPGPAVAALPLVIVIQFVFTISIAYIVATLQVRFRDTQHLLGILLFLMFYLTPVFWDDTNIPEPFKSIMQLNPVALLLNAYRRILIRGEWPDALPLLSVSVIAIVMLAFGYRIFSLARDRFVEEL